MIPLRCLTAIFQKDEEEVLNCLKYNGINSSKIDNVWQVDEISFFQIIWLKLKLSQCDEYLAEEVKIRNEQISDILLQLDDLIYLFNTIKKTAPILKHFIKEITSLIPDELQRNIFTDIISGIGISEVALKYNLSFEKICYLNDSALKHINKTPYSVTQYQCDSMNDKTKLQDMKIKKRYKEKINLHKLGITCDISSKGVSISDIAIPQNVVDILSHNIIDVLDIQIRTINCLLAQEIDTVEDLLRFAKRYGLNQLLRHHNFGRKSLNKLKEELNIHGIIDKNGHSDYYKYLQ